MELDIYIPSIRLGIEFDGANWHNSAEQLEREKNKSIVQSVTLLSSAVYWKIRFAGLLGVMQTHFV